MISNAYSATPEHLPAGSRDAARRAAILQANPLFQISQMPASSATSQSAASSNGPVAASARGNPNASRSGSAASAATDTPIINHTSVTPVMHNGGKHRHKTRKDRTIKHKIRKQKQKTRRQRKQRK